MPAIRREQKYSDIERVSLLKHKAIGRIRKLTVGENVTIKRIYNYKKTIKKVTGRLIYKDDYKIILEIKPYRRLTVLTNDLISPNYDLVMEGIG